jgi:tol-pal system protein YbgF
LEQVSQEVQNRGGGKNGQRPHAAGSGHQPSVVPSPSSSGQAHDGAARHQESATGSDQESPRTAHLTEPAGGHEQEELVSKPPATKQTERPDKVEYERLLAAFREGDLEGARKGFTAFLSRYPNSDLAPNARYWLGESHYGKKDYKQAIDAYDRVELDYPQSEKVPAAILKKGYAYLALKDKKRATSAFRQIVTLYPKSPEAEKAGDKLSQLKESR